jgi:peptidoglycan-associated lipoprotein
MQPRLAALLFALGLVDLAFVNLGLGREVFADTAAEPALEQSPSPSAEPGVDEPPAASVAPPPSIAPPTEPAPSVPTPANDLTAPELGPSHPGAPAALTETSPNPTEAEVPSAPATDDPALDAPVSDLTVGFPEKAMSTLTPRAREALIALAARLRANPGYRVHITGHADARGSREFNKDLGGRRARAVSELLLRAGVPREQIATESRGEDQPRANGTSERVWAVNRRVEITIGNERSEGP